MAQIANSHATFNSTRNREQVLNKIFNVSVDETPALALIGKTKCDGVLDEWITDSFRAGASNKVEQGNTATPVARVDTVRYSNRTQISEDVLSITGTQQKTEKYGPQDQVEFEVTKAKVALKKDIEFGFWQNTTAIAASSGVAPQARGFFGFVATNISIGGGSGAAPNALTNTAGVDGTQRALTETLLKDVLKLMFDNGAPMTNLYSFIPSLQRTIFDGFLAGQTRFDKAEDKTLTATLEVYIGPFGRTKAVNARHMRTREIGILDPEYAKLAMLRPMDSKALGVRGDAIEKLINCEWTVRILNEKAHGAIKDLT